MKRGYRIASLNWCRLRSVYLIRTALLTFFLSLAVTVFIPADSHAMDISGNVKWELIYISANPGCANYQYQMTNVYDEMVSKYFELYEFENSKYRSQCMPDTKYSEYKIPDDLDLLVLVYDKQIGKKELHPSNIGSFYSHLGQDRTKNHIVVLCDCPTHGFSYPQFTLSHELSHFITYYLGFDLAVQNTIHDISAKYNECSDSRWDNTICPSTVTQIQGDYYFSHATVMAPYQPAIGKKLFSENTTVNDIARSQVVMNIQKEITKWWLAGKINDTEYANGLEHLVGKTNETTTNKLPENVLLASGRNGQEEIDTYFDLGIGDTPKTQTLLKRIPFKINNMDLPDKIQIPQWFKSMAQGWSQNKSMSNDKFVDSIGYLFGTENDH